jgi:acetyl esterase/lipase
MQESAKDSKQKKRIVFHDAESNSTKRAIHRRWWFILLEVLLALFLCLAIVLTTSTGLQARAIRLLCSTSASTATGDPADVLTLQTDVSYESAFPNGTLDLYSARSSEPLPLVVYAHGGYYVGGDKSSLTDYCRTLAAYGYVVANLNYELAPDGQYPTQLLQVNEAIAFLIQHADAFGIDPSRVFIGGDSAGGHLASQMGLYYTNTDFCQKTGGTPAILAEQLRGVILLCGYYNTETVRATRFPMIADSIWILTGEKQFEGTEVSARMNTVAQVTPAYPPAFLACGDQDPFVSQAQELIVALAKNGVESSAYLPESKEESLGHEFQIQLDSAAGKEAMRRVAQFLADHATIS